MSSWERRQCIPVGFSRAFGRAFGRAFVGTSGRTRSTAAGVSFAEVLEPSLIREFEIVYTPMLFVFRPGEDAIACAGRAADPRDGAAAQFGAQIRRRAPLTLFIPPAAGARLRAVGARGGDRGGAAAVLLAQEQGAQDRRQGAAAARGAPRFAILGAILAKSL